MVSKERRWGEKRKNESCRMKTHDFLVRVDFLEEFGRGDVEKGKKGIGFDPTGCDFERMGKGGTEREKHNF